MDFTELKKWENELNTCIRYGYCYEHCPLFKSFDWESIHHKASCFCYGLLTGELQPSAYITEKIFGSVALG